MYRTPRRCAPCLLLLRGCLRVCAADKYIDTKQEYTGTESGFKGDRLRTQRARKPFKVRDSHTHSHAHTLTRTHSSTLPHRCRPASILRPCSASRQHLSFAYTALHTPVSCCALLARRTATLPVTASNSCRSAPLSRQAPWPWRQRGAVGRFLTTWHRVSDACGDTHIHTRTHAHGHMCRSG